MKVLIFVALFGVAFAAPAKNDPAKKQDVAPMLTMAKPPTMPGPPPMHMGMGPMGGKGPHGPPPPSHSAVDLKVDDCLSKYTKGAVNIFLNMDPKMAEDMHKEMMEDSSEDSSEEDDGSAERQKMFAAMMNSTQGANMRKMMAIKMTGHIARFTDKILRNFPKEKINIAFGFAQTWYYIIGSEPAKANWTVMHEQFQKQFNMSGMFQMFKNQHGGMPPQQPMMRQQMAGQSGMPGQSGMGMPSFMPGQSGMGMPPHFGPPGMRGPPGMGHGGPGGRHMKMFTDASDNLRYGLVQQILGQQIPFPTQKPDSFANPTFQIVVTCSDFDPAPIGKIDVIFDVFGKFSNQTSRAHYMEENVYLAADPEDAEVMIPTVRYRMCQRNGGVDVVQPPKPTRPTHPPRPSTVAMRKESATNKPVNAKPSNRPTNKPPNNNNNNNNKPGNKKP
jgi:hypothetical protein